MLRCLIIKDLSESTINNLGSTPGLITERVWGGNRAANGQLLPIIPCHTYSYILHITRQLFLMINKILFRSSEGKWSHLCYCHPAFLPEPPSIVILFIFFIIFLFYFLSYFYFIILYHLIFFYLFLFFIVPFLLLLTCLPSRSTQSCYFRSGALAEKLLVQNKPHFFFLSREVQQVGKRA